MTPPGLRSIDIRQLRYFLVLAEELNFRRAAERLHLTQPPLSRQIAALESALGVTLLDRDGPATRLTTAGQRARMAFQAAVQAFDAALAEAAAGGLRGTLRLGLPWWMDMSAFQALDAGWRATAGRMPLEPVLETGPQLLDGLRRQSLDAALIAMPHELHGLRHAPVASLHHVALLPSGSALARKRALRLRELEALPPFLRFPKRQNPALWMHYQRQYEAVGFRPTAEAAAPGTTATIAQIAAGRGCTLMPVALARQRYRGVVARRLLDDISVEVHLVFSDGLEAELVAALTAERALFEAALR
ncbi:MAG TPA: LysR family transcriptional regulator [Roseateles sp.]|uniref:LysR family transcriptional regulator n=1 Tax=Roseateles sp. TaxID=1971397 RepID=UPI002EDB2509